MSRTVGGRSWLFGFSRFIEIPAIDYAAHDSCEDDKDRRYAEEAYQESCGDGYDSCFPCDFSCFSGIKNRDGDKGDDSGANTFKDAYYGRIIFILGKEHCYQEDNDKRGQGSGEEAHEAAFDFSEAVADKNCGVYCEDSGE